MLIHAVPVLIFISRGYRLAQNTASGSVLAYDVEETGFVVEDLSPNIAYTFILEGYVVINGQKVYGYAASVTIRTTEAGKIFIYFAIK